MALYSNFYSHARVGRDKAELNQREQAANFYSHARVGRDVTVYSIRDVIPDFYSHARVGRDSVPIRFSAITAFLLTRPRRA